MTPPKPPRKSLSMKYAITSSYDVPQSACEDPDASMPAVTDGSQSEVKVKPVPRPRSKLQPKAQCNTSNNTVDSVDTTSNTTNVVSCQLSEYPADYERPCPVRPPPRPPMSICVTSSQPTTAVDGGSHYMKSNTEPTVKPPAVGTERIQSPTPSRPERPALPSNYYDRLSSSIRPKPEIYADESQQSRRSSTSSIRQTSVSPALYEEVVSLCGTYGSTAPDRPAVPPRLGQSSLPRPASVSEVSPQQTRPPPPPFNPPTPPSIRRQSESTFSEIEHRPYLDVLPEDDDRMSQRQSTTSGQQYQSGVHASHQQTTENAEDINGMLRWLKRVSKSDFMTPSLYGLSIDEEIRSFNQRAMNVRKALRLFNLLMMKRSESLRDLITEFSSISDSLDKMQKKTKTMDIAGGTTGAVGGVTAVLGIALAPITMGVSLIATAVGAGMVASAGGIGAHNAKVNKKIVNRMTVEKLVCEYKANVVDLEYCLDFILSEMNELRRYDIARLQRAGAQPDALKMAHLSQSVFSSDTNNDRRASVTHSGGMSSEKLLQAFAKEMDQYFSEKSQRLKKSNKSRFSGRVQLLAVNLQDELGHLNCMWEMFS
ncbi:uncharacterized protein [Enoplosus armatus]|uniref:uncharacterized protein n=1 Tax=Enoplosus armatus TaxID=215367 RepID=UPI0039935F5C